MGNSMTPEQRDVALSEAAEGGMVKKVDSLLKRGANPNRKFSERRSRTSLHTAAKTKNNVNVLTKLLQHIKDVDETDEDGNTALHLAAGYYNNISFVETLLNAGPNCKIQNKNGETALHSAINGGNEWKIIELLLRAESDPNVADFNGNTPLHLCASKRGVDPMLPGMLLRFAANPNLKNEDGQTALHVASKTGNKSVLLLLKFHAKVRIRDKDGKKASEIAATDDIREILLCEERELEERTTRQSQSSLTRTSSRASQSSDDVTGKTPTYYLNGEASWAELQNDWKGSGGDGVIHLPDKSDIVVPPQSVPYGTTVKLNITPSKKQDSNVETEDEIPEFDFDLYNFEIDIKLDLPGIVMSQSWTSDSQILPSHSSSTSSPAAFTGMCMEGRNRWKSTREVACKRDGMVAMHFRLSREKSTPLSYKEPPPKQRSAIEVDVTRPTRNGRFSPEIQNMRYLNLDDIGPAVELESQSPSLTSSDDESDIDDVGEDNTMSMYREGDMFEEEPPRADVITTYDDVTAMEEEKHDAYDRLNNIEYYGNFAPKEEEEQVMRYDQHPIDPALDTIPEETNSITEFYENPTSSSGSSEVDPVLSDDDDINFDVTLDDVDSFQNAMKEKNSNGAALQIYQ
nr:uncharacterized protein LOC100178965 [Ciona intestinalis]|eukprot:XP_002123609.1 uncharacterized protein LOC100178965 [Ciona intestinalis]